MYATATLPPDTTETIDPKRRYRCRHVFTEGHRCGSPALRGQDLCYYHHTSRREPSLAGRNGYFLMPRIDDRSAIQIALYDILNRLAQFDIDLKRAGMLLYGLQIASSNLAKREKTAANTEPLVEDVTSSPFLGDLAPITEIPDPAEPTETSGAPEPALSLPKGSTASPSTLGLQPTNVAAPIITPTTAPNIAAPPITSVILSAAKNPRIQPEAPQTTADNPKPPESSKPRQTHPNRLPRGLARTVHPRTSNLEPNPNLEPSTVPSSNIPTPTPYNRPNDFAYSGLPASPRSIPFPG